MYVGPMRAAALLLLLLAPAGPGVQLGHARSLQQIETEEFPSAPANSLELDAIEKEGQKANLEPGDAPLASTAVEAIETAEETAAGVELETAEPAVEAKEEAEATETVEELKEEIEVQLEDVEEELAAEGEGDDEVKASGLSGLAHPEEGFFNGFIRSFLVILVIEVGDRTFFIAALMGIKHNQVMVFLGAFSALSFMTVVSTLMGVAAPMLLPRWFTHIAAFVLFAFFGCQLLYKAYGMEHGVSEELEEVEEELEAAAGKGGDDQPLWRQFINPTYVQAFTMTALAEWGDRSQIATIAMAADYNPYGITIGGSLGHGFATLGAVVGGRLLATKISEKTITILGGSTFLIFAVLALFEDPDEDMAKAVPEWMTKLS